MEEPSGDPAIDVMVEVAAVKTLDMKCKGGKNILIASYIKDK